MALLYLDLASNSVTGTSIVAAAQTTSLNGAAVDLQKCVGNMASAILDVGAVSGTQGTFDVKMQASTATNTGFTDISGATFTQVTTSGLTTGGAFQIISFQVPARYVRAVGTAAGTFTSMLLGVSVLGQRSANPDNAGGFSNQGAAVS